MKKRRIDCDEPNKQNDDSTTDNDISRVVKKTKRDDGPKTTDSSNITNQLDVNKTKIRAFNFRDLGENTGDGWLLIGVSLAYHELTELFKVKIATSKDPEDPLTHLIESVEIHVIEEKCMNLVTEVRRFSDKQRFVEKIRDIDHNQDKWKHFGAHEISRLKTYLLENASLLCNAENTIDTLFLRGVSLTHEYNDDYDDLCQTDDDKRFEIVCLTIHLSIHDDEWILSRDARTGQCFAVEHPGSGVALLTQDTKSLSNAPHSSLTVNGDVLSCLRSQIKLPTCISSAAFIRVIHYILPHWNFGSSTHIPDSLNTAGVGDAWRILLMESLSEILPIPIICDILMEYLSLHQVFNACDDHFHDADYESNNDDAVDKLNDDDRDHPHQGDKSSGSDAVRTPRRNRKFHVNKRHFEYHSMMLRGVKITHTALHEMEWNAHTDLYRRAYLQTGDNPDTYSQEIGDDIERSTEWCIKNHMELCCARRHYDSFIGYHPP